jgi:hypothetical protein
MSTSFKIPGTIVTSLAAVALAAPGAGAMPIHAPSEFDSGHASVAKAAATRQDLRSPDAKDAAITLHRSGTVVPSPHTRIVFPSQVDAGPAPVNQDDGTPWLAIALSVAGGLAVGGAVAGVGRPRVRARRSGVAA